MVDRKTCRFHLDRIGACDRNDELKAALPVGLLRKRRARIGLVGLAQRDLGAGDDAACCIVHHAADAKARLRPQSEWEDRQKENENEMNPALQ